MTESRVEIPGRFIAHLDEAGQVSRLTFTPSAGDAGFFGVAAELVDVDGLEPHDAEGWCELEHELAADDVEGPFWDAMRVALGTTTRFASMDDNADDSVVEGPQIPIEWTE